MLYTRKGDSGTTSTFGCDQRISKSSAVAEALGALDEVNSYLGLCRADMRGRSALVVPNGKKGKSVEAVVRDIQETLFIVQAETAGAKKHVSKTKVTALEAMTNGIEQVIPPIHSFSVSGGTYLSALFDVARTLARKAERRVVAVAERGDPIHKDTLTYLNRLSSLLFALARFANTCEGIAEESPTYR